MNTNGVYKQEIINNDELLDKVVGGVNTSRKKLSTRSKVLITIGSIIAGALIIGIGVILSIYVYKNKKHAAAVEAAKQKIIDNHRRNCRRALANPSIQTGPQDDISTIPIVNVELHPPQTTDSQQLRFTIDESTDLVMINNIQVKYRNPRNGRDLPIFVGKYQSTDKSKLPTQEYLFWTSISGEIFRIVTMAEISNMDQFIKRDGMKSQQYSDMENKFKSITADQFMQTAGVCDAYYNLVEDQTVNLRCINRYDNFS